MFLVISSSFLRTSSSIRNISMEDISSFKNKRSWLGPSGKLFSFIRPKTFFLSQYKDCSKEATLLMSIALSWRSISISSNKAFLFFHKHLYLFISHCKYTKYNDIQKLSGYYFRSFWRLSSHGLHETFAHSGWAVIQQIAHTVIKAEHSCMLGWLKTVPFRLSHRRYVWHIRLVCVFLSPSTPLVSP